MLRTPEGGKNHKHHSRVYYRLSFHGVIRKSFEEKSMNAERVLSQKFLQRALLYHLVLFFCFFIASRNTTYIGTLSIILICYLYSYVKWVYYFLPPFYLPTQLSIHNFFC
uniref:Uncharacterized protein n=1 Tax=Cacopsylla melanoneura TaxID=428564 RepID=A0A8D8W9Y5_9HEMI